ncbi:MAG: two-component system, OmpR family, phosphate regulon sensor histidine kinase PhoR [Thiomicrorhabdus sp.]|nr:MAG: two-component system, OmpR family, phosphate regulon sensor histidine kinase PhoR [Thiomicrorhabdus sp.]
MFLPISKAISRELTWVVGSFWIFLCIAWVTGLWTGVLIAYILFYIGRHIWSVSQFEKWIKGGTQQAYPPSSGSWAELSHLVSIRQRVLEKHADLQNYKSGQFHAASMALPIAIVSLTQDNKIEWFNHSAQKLLSIKQGDAGRKIEALVRKPDFIQYLKAEVFDKPIFTSFFIGHSRIYRCDILDYHQGHRLLLLEDVNELYMLAQIRRDFIANASHELRTPLTVLNGYLEMMIDMPDQVPVIWKKPLDQMFHQSIRMKAIVEDLLALSRIESDTLMNKTKEVKVDEVLESIEIDIRHLYATDYDIHFAIEKGLHLNGVEESLKSVFTNLISNAFHYTLKGGSVCVFWYSDSSGAHFKVEDTGIGIAKEHISRLTERFYRIDTARSRDTGGTGLGLAIVKHVLEKHDAELMVTSQVAKGSVFSCNFDDYVKK